MCNITITPNTPPAMARAIAEGAVKAENEALKETIDMLLCEIAQKDELLELYRWKEQRNIEQVLRKYRESAPKKSIWQRVAAVISGLKA